MPKRLRHCGMVQGAVYASKASPDSPAMLVYRPFQAWAPNSDWSLPVPEGEVPLAVAAARSLLALATSNHTLRLFSPAGESSISVLLRLAPMCNYSLTCLQ